MTCPRDSSWATTLHGRPEHERWLRRFARVGIQSFADEVLVTGLPMDEWLAVHEPALAG